MSEDIKELGELPGMKDAPIAPAHAIASIALSMAMKWHDISTVKDGALYQQYKLEGKNMTPLHLDMVFETAKQIEAHLMASPGRIQDYVFDAIEEEIIQENQGDDNA